MCGITVEVQGDRVTSIRGDQGDVFSRGYICPKATALGDIHHDPDRLKRPIKRTASGWVELSWEEAFDEVATQLGRIRDRHGPHSVGFYLGNPNAHNYSSILFGLLFIKALRSHSRFSATSVDQLPKMLAALKMFGHQLLMPVPDIDRTDYFLIFGANPAVSNGSLMSAPGCKRRITQIKERGGKVVLFDPRRTETARLASEHLFIQPGKDALVLFALLHTIFEEGLVNLGRFPKHLKGLDLLRNAARDFSPERVAGPTGVAAETLTRIAREFATTKRAVAYGRVGVSMQEFGGIANWLLEALNIVTGHFDEAGGAMFTTPAIDLVTLGTWLGEQGHYDKFRSRVRGAPEFSGELPAACLAEEIDTPGENQIRSLVTLAGNPVLSLPNGRRLDAALSQLEFMVSIDIYLNETTRHAHLILPPTFALEHDHYDVILHSFAVRNTAKYAQALFPRQPEQRHDWEIMIELTSRLGVAGTPADALLRKLKRLALGQLHPQRILDLLIRMGPYGMRKGRAGLTLRKIESQAGGIDLGPLASRMPERLHTADRKIDLAPPVLLADVARLQAVLRTKAAEPPVEEGMLLLIGRRQLRSNNSWCHNSPRLIKGGERCTLLIHPQDAEARGIKTGARVRVASRVGEIAAPAEVTDDVMRGVVSLPHGFGHNREGTRWRVAEAHAGVSINDLTDEQRLDTLAGTANFSGLPVRVELSP
jgi:anaerobic selenocysteine-containing dehydrogenase